MSGRIKTLAFPVLKFLSGGLVASILAVFMVEYLTDKRERRANLHTFVTVWYGVYLGNSRDEISTWLLTPEGNRLRDLPDREYYPALINAFQSNEAPATAILSIIGFFRAVDACTADGRCGKEETYAAFEPSASEFHDLFRPLLRTMDCEWNYLDTEKAILNITGRNDTPFPERCEELEVITAAQDES